MRRMLVFCCFLIAIAGSFPVFAEEKASKKSYDYSNLEFKETVNMLNMEGHSTDSLATCSVKQLYYEEVAEMMFTKGMSKQEILDYYVKEQGEQALNAPRVKGFNYSLWITPFLLLMITSIIIYFAVRKWKRNHAMSADEETINTNELEFEHDLYWEMIEKERKKIF